MSLPKHINVPWTFQSSHQCTTGVLGDKQPCCVVLAHQALCNMWSAHFIPNFVYIAKITPLRWLKSTF